MRTLNKVMLIGRLGKDPEIQTFESGTVKASFPLATNEVYTDRNGNKVENTDWHNIIMWRGLASVAEKYLRKGSLVYLEGKVKTRSWEDRESGSKRYITEIEVNDLKMLDSRPTVRSSADNSSVAGSEQTTTSTTTQTTSAPNETVSPKESIDDLPF